MSFSILDGDPSIDFYIKSSMMSLCLWLWTKGLIFCHGFWFHTWWQATGELKEWLSLQITPHPSVQQLSLILQGKAHLTTICALGQRITRNLYLAQHIHQILHLFQYHATKIILIHCIVTYIFSFAYFSSVQRIFLFKFFYISSMSFILVKVIVVSH